MLYTEAKAYLIQKLKDAGLNTKPHTTMKSLSRTMESHVGAVLPGTETLTRNGSKTIYRDQEGAQHKRRKIFDRDVTIQVILGDYNDGKVEEMLDRFLASLDRGIEVGGNFVPLEVSGVEWDTEADHPLKAEVAVRVSITFQGGVYKDTDFRRVKDYVLEDVQKMNGKEPGDGNERNQG